jgi:hypothetical protein
LRLKIDRALRFAKANAIALAALFLALGGTSYAALHLPANSVGRLQLRAHAVTANKLARGSVTIAALSPALGAALRSAAEPAARPGTIRSGPIEDGVVRGFLGPTLQGTDIQTGVAMCAPSEQATGGGLQPAGNLGSTPPSLVIDAPIHAIGSTQAIGWEVELVNSNLAGAVFAICAASTPGG